MGLNEFAEGWNLMQQNKTTGNCLPQLMNKCVHADVHRNDKHGKEVGS